MKPVLVIVVTYNGMAWLSRCLDSVAGPGVSADLFVVDNDSTDGSADFVAGHYPSAKLIRSAENLGFSKANNLGFDYALKKGYDYVYLLNQDAWLEAGALERLLAVSEAHPEYAVLSPLQMTDGYKALDAQFAKLYPGSSEAQVVDIRRVMAAHWLLPVRAIREVGVFNESLFPHWGQDDDWCQRARYHRMKVGVVPAARAVHDRASREESPEKLVRRNYYTGSLVRLADVNRPLWERFAFVCLFTLVKAIKYRSLLVFKYFRTICKQLPEVKEHRRNSR